MSGALPHAAPPGASAPPLQAAEPQQRHDSGPGARNAGAAITFDAPTAAADALGPAPARPDGISLAGLRAFVAEHGGEEGLAGKTTSEVKWEIVVPETKAAACSYANLLRERERGGGVLAAAGADALLSLLDLAAASPPRRRAAVSPSRAAANPCRRSNLSQCRCAAVPLCRCAVLLTSITASPQVSPHCRATLPSPHDAAVPQSDHQQSPAMFHIDEHHEASPCAAGTMMCE